MVLKYSEVIKMLGQAFIIKSKSEFISEFDAIISDSLDVANKLEDYDYLSVFAEITTKFDNFVIAYDLRYNAFEYPVILEINKDLTLMDFAQLYYKCKHSIHMTTFLKCIEAEANYNSMDPGSLYVQFEIYIASINDEVRESERKIQRNEQCPCNSGKKYKHCHGQFS